MIGLITVGLYMTRIEDLATKFELYQLHKSFGFTVFALASLRLGWRFVNPTPALPTTMPAWERRLAEAVHVGLYGALAAVPLTGWLMASTSPYAIPTIVFGLFALPHPLAPDAATHETLILVHRIAAYTLAAMVALHVAGALKHHFITGDEVLRRMLPFRD